MYKMYLEDVIWDGKDAPCVLILKNCEDGGFLSIGVHESVGFDLRTLLNQKRSGFVPYFGICALVSQIGATVKKLTVKNDKLLGTAEMLIEIGGRIKEIELFFADVISVSIVEDLPIFFDESVCSRLDLPLDQKILWSRTEDITNYSFETNG